ncbi:hypothetical protein QZH41_006499 [Actinostola sp. cb2023]|nr:hypothetical protein QZH41_006499 [Actinostola sp. cb2023]
MKFLFPLAFLAAFLCLNEARPIEDEVDLVEDNAGRNLARIAMNNWSSKTCLKFKQRTNEKGYLEFKYDGPCSLGSSIHELGHAIGFFHENSRPDRDNFININFKNIRKGVEGNFRKDNGAFVDSRGHDYDYGSIMHYSRYQGNNKAGAVVIQPKKANVEIGQRDGLSDADIVQTKDMYKCDAQGDSHLEPLEDEDEDSGVNPPPNPEGPKPGEIEE